MGLLKHTETGLQDANTLKGWRKEMQHGDRLIKKDEERYEEWQTEVTRLQDSDRSRKTLQADINELIATL